ncbi:MAG: dipeptidase [Acidimicrobiia bacterium]
MTTHRAMEIHRHLPVVDGHNDLPWKLRTLVDGDLDRLDPSGDLPSLHTDIPRLIEGGVGAQLWSVYVPADIDEPFARTMAQIDLVERMVERDHRLEMARTGAEARDIRDSGHIASLLGAEGGHSIEGSLDNLHALSERGVRYMTLTHSDTTEWADSATDAPKHQGLSAFGREVVQEMNRLGMLVDLSHVSVDTMRDALDTTDSPVIASHSNSSALAHHPRNIPDDVLAAIGDGGGVVMVVFFSGFVVAETALQTLEMFEDLRRVREQLAGDEAAFDAEMERLGAERDLDRGTVADVVNHIEHIAEVAGIEAVGIGSDFDGTFLTPVGLDDVSCYPAITDELLGRGWDEQDIVKVLGENSLRVLG